MKSIFHQICNISKANYLPILINCVNFYCLFRIWYMWMCVCARNTFYSLSTLFSSFSAFLSFFSHSRASILCLNCTVRVIRHPSVMLTKRYQLRNIHINNHKTKFENGTLNCTVWMCAKILQNRDPVTMRMFSILQLKNVFYYANCVCVWCV